MRICFVTHKLVHTDGQGRINLEVAKHMAATGHQVVAICSEIDPALRDLPNVTWRLIKPSKLPTALLKFARFGRRAKKTLRADPHLIDILQTNGNITAAPADVNVAMFVHSNWIKSPYHANYKRHGVYAIYQRLFTRIHSRSERREFRRARRTVALSTLVHDSLVTDIGLSPERIEVIMPGVDTTEFRPAAEGETNPLRSLIGVDDAAFVVFFAGDLKSNRKNLDLLLKALQQLPASVHIVCPGGLRESPYPAMAKEMGVSDRVHFIGHRTDLGLLFRGANAFAFPSHYDTFALVVTEAMASGLPVITSPAAGASSFVDDGINGILMRDSNDLETVVTTLKKLADSPIYARELGRSARLKAEQWTWADMAKQYEALYHRILAEKAAAL